MMPRNKTHWPTSQNLQDSAGCRGGGGWGLSMLVNFKGKKRAISFCHIWAEQGFVNKDVKHQQQYYVYDNLRPKKMEGKQSPFKDS